MSYLNSQIDMPFLLRQLTVLKYIQAAEILAKEGISAEVTQRNSTLSSHLHVY